MAFSFSHPKSSYVPSREEVSKHMRQIPSFTERETLVRDMGVPFPTTQQILVEIDNDPSRSFMARLSYNTSNISLSRIMPMQDYTNFETIEVVIRLSFSTHFVLASCLTMVSLLPPQVIARVHNLIRQRAQLFYWLEVAKTMKAYLAHHMDGSEALIASLEMTKSEVVTARRIAEEGVGLLIKVEEEKEAIQVEARQLVEENEAMEADKKKVKDEAGRLRQKLQDLRAGFATQKDELEAEYQKEVDDMSFYGYRCCMKKHDIPF